MRQQDGTAVPDWVQVNVATGELIIDTPQSSGTLQLTLVAVDGNEQRSIDLEVNLDEMREEDIDKEEELQGDKEETEAGELVPQKNNYVANICHLMTKSMRR